MWDAFDILKKLPDGGIVWIESAKDLETARERIKLLASYKPGEYVIFSQETQSVIGMPWVPFTREAAETTDCRQLKKTDAKEKEAPKETHSGSSGTAKTSQVIANIVADIARILRHKD
jgi:hypothetical protein